ncbi:MAG TPA: ROK family protein, partial [Pyrinomonadaceae bacterium]|nr:ROK family protein [Pyrinomonadaceae bacterium]
MPFNSKSENNFAGIEIGGTTMRAIVISETGEVIARREAAYQPEDLVPEINKLVSELREAGTLKSVGVGIPGLVNRETDRVLISTGLPSVVRGDLHSELMKETGLRFELENDANAAAYGEYKAGAGREARDIFYIGIGDSIGGAIILDGKLWIGASGCAGEVGHITINTEGAEC